MILVHINIMNSINIKDKYYQEEKCGIKKAIEEGKISQERYERFCKIYEQLKEKEKRKW